MRHAWLAMLFGSLIAACNGGDDGSGGGGSSLSAETAAVFEGVYAIGEVTQNEAGCDTDGPSVLDQLNEQHIVAVAVTVFGRQLEVASCLDVSDCQTKAAAFRDGSGAAARFIFTFNAERGPDEVSGFNATSGVERDGVCQQREYTNRVMARSGDDLHIVSRTKALPDRPPEEGFCVVSGSDAQREAEPLPCTSLHVIEATHVADLP